MKKKIAILTTPLLYNYGGILQAYALMETLKKMGYSPELIQIRYEKVSKIKFLKNIIKGLIAKYILKQKKRVIFDSISTIKGQKTITQHTAQFISKNIYPQTSPIYGVTNLINNKEIDEQYHAIIVGSDQVWRPKYSDVFSYFLGFLDPKSKTKRISYAASFGVDNWEFSSDQAQLARDLISRFSAVAVREDSGVEICKKHLGVDAIHVLDPTLLLTQDEYNNLIDIEKKSIKNEDYLLVYLLDITPDKTYMIEQLCFKYKLKPIYVNNFETEKAYMSAKKRIVPPLENWLFAYCNSKFVLTDSFHGTVFSIIFNIPFITLGNKDRGLSRFSSLLKIFNLESRLILSKEEINLSHEEINWQLINTELEVQREKSLNFLKLNI